MRPFCHFEPLQKGDPTVARRKPQQKNPKNLRYALFLDTSLALSMTKFMTQRVFGMARQVSMINLGCRLNFLKQMKNLKNLKNLQIFLKKIIRGAKTTLCVAGLCYNELV